MKKQIQLLFLFVMTVTSIFSQKVDLDKYDFEANVLKLPEEYTAPRDRTYGVKIDATKSITYKFSADMLYDKIKIDGFEKVERNPTIGINFALKSFKLEKLDIKERIQDDKDKSGKTVKTYYYKMIAKYSLKGNTEVYGPKKLSQKELQQQKEKQAKEGNNRFLSEADKISSGTTGTQQGVVMDYNINEYKESRSNEFRTPYEAREYYDANKTDIEEQMLLEMVEDAIKNLNEKLAAKYGYVPTTEKDHLWIVANKSHPEYTTQQEAIRAVKVLMKTMDATQPIDVLAQKLNPLIDYFEGLKTKYKSDDKGDKKMRYSAYFNLAKIYYYLDEHSKAIKECEGLILNDWDPKDGKNIMEDCKNVKIGLAFHKMKTRHIGDFDEKP